MVDGGGTELEKDMGRGFMNVGEIVNVVDGVKRNCFSEVIAVVSQLLLVTFGRCKNMGV